jgi:Rhodanese-like domain
MNGAMMFSNMFSRFAPGADPRTIDHEEFEQAVKAGKCIVVDVREPHEFASARIPGSFNMPMSRFDPSRLPSEKPVAPVCNSGMRSRSAKPVRPDARASSLTPPASSAGIRGAAR